MLMTQCPRRVYRQCILFDCYRLTGQNTLAALIRDVVFGAGAHYTQFMVYDFDGDGRAEIIMKTSDGTIDGQGNIIRRCLLPIIMTRGPYTYWAATSIKKIPAVEPTRGHKIPL